ncbi:MAG: orotidine-5'-phosphate decarboxylase [Chloroflexi bacterium]|nr:orotidine-5'-phosphate decarboxylase [Chloroflexota bacterium]
MTFVQKLQKACRKNNSLLCVGLDPDPAKMPAGQDTASFCKAIIKATSAYVCAYKPNLAFFEALGDNGITILKDVLKSIPEYIVTIADAKRGDIGNTATAYAKALYDDLGFDCVTLSPYMGYDSIEPFIKYHNKGVFLLCRTSNSGAADFQQLKIQDGRFLYEVVAQKASEWNTAGNIGLVVGATAPDELKIIRNMCSDMILLVPGVGAQGGDIEKTVRMAIDKNSQGVVINSSRQIIYASKEENFAQKAAMAAKALRDEINQYR